MNTTIAQSTGTATSNDTRPEYVDNAYLVGVLRRLASGEAEAREALRTARFALDDLATAHETMRQVRAELTATIGIGDASVVDDTSVPAHALVIEHGPCRRPEVAR